MQKHDLHRVVSFHSRISSARHFASRVLEVAAWMPRSRRPTGRLWAEHVSGKMTSGERETKLNRLRAVPDDERGLLSNARCLSEGVDVPTLDGVAFIDPRRSQVDVVQAVGRAIRKAEDKVVGTIVIPVLVDTTADPEQALDDSEFDRVWEVVKALRDHDHDLAEELDALRRGLGQRGSIGERPRRIVLDLPAGVGLGFARAFDTRLVEATSESWEQWYGVLQRFALSQGHSRVPVHHVEGHSHLGAWVANQRTINRQHRLSAERVARLEALPGWTWEPHGSAWEDGFASLQLFAERHGHTVVPADLVEHGYPVGRWVTKQRDANADRKGRRRLAPHRIARLEALPGWTWDPLDSNWEERFAALLTFVAREDHALVPASHVENGLALGNWVSTQRKAHKDGELRQERVTRLNAVRGWAWDPHGDAWSRGYLMLKSFASREGHARPDKRQNEDGYPLGRWVSQQRTRYRAHRLSSERIAQLEALPGWSWDTLGSKWDNWFACLEGYVAREGQASVPLRHIEHGRRLGTWVSGQRMAYRKGELSPSRVARLEALPGWTWDALESDWEEAFASLAGFVEREGHARVPQMHTENGFPLGTWVANQRGTYRRGRLSAERMARLESVSGWAWSTSKTA